MELVLEYLSEGGSFSDVIDGYPSLTEDSIRAAIAFMHDLLIKEAESARREAA